MAKLMFFDLETTGLEPEKHSLFQIATILEIDGIIKQRKSYLARPVQGALVSPEALAVNNMTMERLRELPPPETVLSQFVKDLMQFPPSDEKYTIIAYNSSFDKDFLIAWFKKIASFRDYNALFYSGSVDVMGFAAWKLRDDRASMPNFKQGTVAKKLGVNVEESETHEGLYDVGLCYNIMQTLFNKPLVNFNADKK